MHAYLNAYLIMLVCAKTAIYENIHIIGMQTVQQTVQLLVWCTSTATLKKLLAAPACSAVALAPKRQNDQKQQLGPHWAPAT